MAMAMHLAGSPMVRPQDRSGQSVKCACRVQPRAPGRSALRCRASKTFIDHTVDATYHTDLVVEVYSGPEEVSAMLCKVVEKAAADSIAQRGHFALAVPGGSVLKMLTPLASSKAIDWTKVHLWYVNHKAVASDDALATSLKAKNYFLDAVGAKPDQVYVLTGTDNAPFEAQAYELTIRKAIDKQIIAKDKLGTPVFDLMLLGMGTDGHVGSLYPGRPEISSKTDKLVLPVDKGKPPASVTFSLPVMNAARHAVVAMVGEGKAKAVQTALEDRKGGFPAQLVKPKKLTWILDKGAASALPALAGVSSLGV